MSKAIKPHRVLLPVAVTGLDRIAAAAAKASVEEHGLPREIAFPILPYLQWCKKNFKGKWSITLLTGVTAISDLEPEYRVFITMHDEKDYFLFKLAFHVEDA